MSLRGSMQTIFEGFCEFFGRAPIQSSRRGVREESGPFLAPPLEDLRTRAAAEHGGWHGGSRGRAMKPIQTEKLAETGPTNASPPRTTVVGRGGMVFETRRCSRDQATVRCRRDRTPAAPIARAARPPRPGTACEPAAVFCPAMMPCPDTSLYAQALTVKV